MIIAATLFSGIGAPETAMPSWHWAWSAEIERFPSAVLTARHPHSVNLGDVTADGFTDRAAAIARPDVIVFGSPCQSFSIAGRRLGMDDPRGNLALVALGIINRLKPRWFVFENVPGLLSSAEGSDFGLFLRTVDELGYCGSWGSLDAQWFGVAQRRERLFFVGHFGDWRGPAAVLFEPESLCGHSAPRRETGKGITPTIASHPTGGGGLGTDFDCDGGLIASQDVGQPLLAKGNSSHRADAESYVSYALNAKGGSGRIDAESETFIDHSLRADGFDASEDGPAYTLDGTGAQGIAFSQINGSALRRLTLRECERLQGFPDDYTAISYRGKPAADDPRYKALGNSMAVPVVRWILSRIEKLHD